MANDLKKYLIFFSLSTFIKGFRRTLICDIQRNKLTLIGNSIHDFCESSHKKSLSFIKSQYDKESQNLVEKYIKYFINNDFAFLGSREDIKNLMDINLIHDFSSKLTNIVIEHSEINFYQLDKLLTIINKLGVSAVQYIAFDTSISVEKLLYLKDTFFKCDSLNTVNFIIKYNHSLKYDNLPDIFKKTNFFEVQIHSAPYSKIFDTSIVYTTEIISKTNSCGNISTAHFTLNKDYFIEAHNYNTCLNKKFSIDADGNMRNCLFMKGHYGKFSEERLYKLITQKKTVKYWNIHKDLIDVCKDCEFRYICSDCRCFIKDPDNIYSQPAKCGYNPYISKWETEEGYMPVETCGSYSKETGFVPDEEKIATLNQLIWRDE